MRLEVGPALGARLLPAGAAAEDPAEEITEVEVAASKSKPPAPRGSNPPAVGRAELVVGLPLLGIREDVVRRLDLLEALLGRGVARSCPGGLAGEPGRPS